MRFKLCQKFVPEFNFYLQQIHSSTTTVRNNCFNANTFYLQGTLIDVQPTSTPSKYNTLYLENIQCVQVMTIQNIFITIGKML